MESPPNTREQLDKENRQGTTSAQLTPKLRVIKSILLFSTWICMGFWISMPPPCMDVLKDLTKSNYEQISIPLAINMVGLTLGSLAIGVTVDRLEKWFDIVIFIDVLIAGLSFAAIPWLSNLVTMSLAFFICGIGAGGWSTAANAHTISMWGKDAPSPMLFIHMGHSCGTVLGPLLLEPFLPSASRHYKENATQRHSELDHQTYGHMFLSENLNHIDIANTSHGSNSSNNQNLDIRIPYAITGGYSVIMSILFLIYFFCNRKPSQRLALSDTSESNQSQRNIVQRLLPTSCIGGDRLFITVMLILILLIYFVMLGKDISLSNFIEPLAVHTPTLNFTMREADILVSIHFATYAVGRMFVAFVARCIPITILMFAEASGTIIAQIALVTVGLNSRLSFWLTTTAYALMAGPLLPSGYTWIDRYVPMTGSTYGILNAGIGLGGFLFQWLSGHIYNSKPPETLLYLSLGCGISLMLLLIVAQWIGSRHGDRFTKEVIMKEVNADRNNEHVSGSEDASLLHNAVVNPEQK